MALLPKDSCMGEQQGNSGIGDRTKSIVAVQVFPSGFCSLNNVGNLLGSGGASRKSEAVRRCRFIISVFHLHLFWGN